MTDWFDRSAAERDQTVADYMQNVAHARIPVAPHLPDPAVLWLKAQILKRWDAEHEGPSAARPDGTRAGGGRPGGRHGPVRNVSARH